MRNTETQVQQQQVTVQADHNNNLIVKHSPNAQKKVWVRVITGPRESDFAQLIKETKTPKGSTISIFELGQSAVFQVCDGENKDHFHLNIQNGNTYINPIKKFQISQFFPKPKQIEFTIKVDADDTESLSKLIDIINQKKG